MVHLILKMTAHCLQKRLLDIYEAWGWDLYDKFDHAYDALKLCLTDPELVYERVNIPEEHREQLLKNIRKKLAAAPIKIRATFDLQCYTYEGIEAIKDSLLEAKK